jgi:hypothetical protein
MIETVSRPSQDAKSILMPASRPVTKERTYLNYSVSSVSVRRIMAMLRRPMVIALYAVLGSRRS